MSQPDVDSARVVPAFAALGDPTRAAIMQWVAREGRLSLTELARKSPISRQAVSRHVGVLTEAGLLKAERTGRELRLSVDREALGPLVDWLSEVSSVWDDTLARLALHLEESDD